MKIQKIQRSKIIMEDGTIWDKTRIQLLLDTSDIAVIQAVKLVHANQTQDEQNIESTRYHNGAGFTPGDARLLSQYTTFYSKRGYLTPKQMHWARKLIRKYWRQLLPHIVAKTQKKAA